MENRQRLATVRTGDLEAHCQVASLDQVPKFGLSRLVIETSTSGDEGRMEATSPNARELLYDPLDVFPHLFRTLGPDVAR